MDTEKESTTIQDDLIKKILEFPYETLGIQKGGIYGDETFDKKGYLSDSNINALRERLIKYKIIGFEFGNFGDYSIQYSNQDRNPGQNWCSNPGYTTLKGKYVYAVYIDETGNFYGNLQLTHIIPVGCSKGRNIPWAEELFVNPFIKWVDIGYNPYSNVSYITTSHHWTQYTGNVKPTDAEIQKENKFLNRIDSIIRCKKIGEFAIKSTSILQCTGHPIRHIYSFKNITLAQVEECENIEAEERRKQEEERIKEEIRLIDLTLEDLRRRDIADKNEKLTQILEYQKFLFLSKNKEYLNSTLLSTESKTRPPPNYESYFNYLCSVYGNIYENLNSMINYVISKVATTIELYNIIFTENESEKFLLMFRKHKSTEAFDKLSLAFYENGHLSLKDITTPVVLLSICNVEPIAKYTINMIECRNSLTENLDDVIILLDILKTCIPEGVIPYNRVNILLMRKWITKKDGELWSGGRSRSNITESLEKTVFQLSVTKRLIVNSLYCNKLTELDEEQCYSETIKENIVLLETSQQSFKENDNSTEEENLSDYEEW
jgi:hypothetical protein